MTCIYEIFGKLLYTFYRAGLVDAMELLEVTMKTKVISKVTVYRYLTFLV